MQHRRTRRSTQQQRLNPCLRQTAAPFRPSSPCCAQQVAISLNRYGDVCGDAEQHEQQVRGLISRLLLERAEAPGAAAGAAGAAAGAAAAQQQQQDEDSDFD